ncbi:MAG: DUF481 domain-containing protein [Bacteroidota bacterium]
MLRRRFLVSLMAFFFCWTISAQIVNIEDRRTNLDTLGWIGRIDLGGRYTRNISEILTLNASLRLDQFGPKHHWLILANYRTAESNGNRFIDSGYAHLRYDRELSDKWSWEAFTQWQFDQNLKLDARWLLGTGPRFSLSEGSKGSINMGLLYMLEYDDIKDRQLFFTDHRLSAYLSLKWKISPTTTISSTSYYQPRLLNFDLPRINSVTTIAFDISKAFQFTTSFYLTRDARINDLFPEIPSLTYTWSNSLRFNF